MIKMENIRKDFNLDGEQVSIIKGITLNIDEGEFVSIMGPSGSGKSTLASILGLLSTPSFGSYWLMGKDISKLDDDSLSTIRNQKIGFIFQDFHLIDGHTALENVMLPLFYRGFSTKKSMELAKQQLERVGLIHRASYFPAQLSGGQKQRVAIARALVTNPSFIFADEPTGALDQKTGNDIMGLLQELNLERQTIIQVTHSAEQARFSKRILSLVDGRIIKDILVENPLLCQFDKNFNSSDSKSINNDIKIRENLVINFWKVASITQSKNLEDYQAIKKFYDYTKHHISILAKVANVMIDWQIDEANNILLDIFHESHWSAKAEIIKMSCKKSDQLCLTLLAKGLQDDNSWVRFIALNQLRFLNIELLPETIKNLVPPLANDEDERVRATVVVYLPILSLDTETFTSIVYQALEDNIERVRANAVEAFISLLSRQEQSEYVEKLRSFLDDPSNRVKANAAYVLFPYLPEECLAKLKTMLASEVNVVRASAAWALGKIDSDQGAEILVQLLGIEKDEAVLSLAIISLGNLSVKNFSLTKQVETIIHHKTASTSSS